MNTITFLIPLKSSTNIKDRDTFNKILQKTLEYTRKVPDHKTIIVCNPATVNSINIENEKIFTIPETNLPYGDEDKEMKVFRGCQYWLYNNLSTHLMILDFDDLVLPSISEVVKQSDSSIYFESGYQQIFNRYYLYSKNFWYHCGSSFIFNKDYISSQMNNYSVGKSWMFHQSHSKGSFHSVNSPHIIQRPWNGENVWWTRIRLRDMFKWFIAKKTLSSIY